MFLLTRWREIFSRDFWKKSKFMSLNSSVGFFVFWNLIFAIGATVASVFVLSMMASTAVDEFRRDFVDFEVKMEDGVLSTQNIPDPFVFSEFMEADPEEVNVGLDDDVIADIQNSFSKGIAEADIDINGRNIRLEDFEFVLDTNGDLGLSDDLIPRDKMGVYVFEDRVVTVDPMSENEDNSFKAETYSDLDAEDFTLDKEYLITKWEDVSDALFGILGFLIFGIAFVGLILVRMLTNFLWAGLIMLFGNFFKFEWDYLEAYGTGLNYFVPITLIELLIIFMIGWLPFMTVGLLVLFLIVHGSAMKNQVPDKPEIIEGE